MPEMRTLVLLLTVALPAYADLYRWVDPDSGSVKFSNLPPTDGRANAELMPYRGVAQQAAATPTTAKPKPAPLPPLEALQARWSALLTQLTGLSPQEFNRGSEGLRQHMEAYEAVRVELDRLDPEGAARRRNESGIILERLRQGFGAAFTTTPPGQK
jgi:hypothetical protein